VIKIIDNRGLHCVRKTKKIRLIYCINYMILAKTSSTFRILRNCPMKDCWTILSLARKDKQLFWSQTRPFWILIWTNRVCSTVRRWSGWSWSTRMRNWKPCKNPRNKFWPIKSSFFRIRICFLKKFKNSLRKAESISNHWLCRITFLCYMQKKYRLILIKDPTFNDAK